MATGEYAATRAGVPALLGTDELDQDKTKRVFVNRVHELEVGPAMEGMTFTRNAGDRINAFSQQFERPDGIKTVTWTFTYQGNNLCTSISEGVVS